MNSPLAIVAAMRKFISLIIALHIVLLSSIPMLPPASACPPAHAAATQGMDDMSGMDGMETAEADGMQMPPDEHHPAMYAHIEAPAAQACIECGCGCHDSIDSLPHMLAPHSPDTASLSCMQASQRVDAPSDIRPEARVLLLFSPPPQSI